MKFQKAGNKDRVFLAELARLLWPEHTLQELLEEIDELIVSPEASFFLAFEENIPVGFAQCQLRRDYVEGSESSPVGYLEGIFVKESFRRKGTARALLKLCQDWAKEQGCSEFASDCELQNNDSLSFHLHNGFQEANRIICFIKPI